MNKKALIAMSGGVDSSVSAAVMLEKGYECIGAMMKLRNAPADDTSCGAANDAQIAKNVADKLGMQFYLFDFVDIFKDKVINNFISEYECGNTPNPCIECNKYMKFGLLLDKAMELGCDVLATGHYAQIEYNQSIGRYQLRKAENASKDQTYVLYTLTQKQLSMLDFPLGSFKSKDEVRQKAAQIGFENASKHESQDICFVPDGDYAGFISSTAGKMYKTGNFVDENGKILGKHKGIIHYTVGQRKGLGLSLPAPLYVYRKDVKTNNVILTSEDRLFCNQAVARDFNWVSISEPTTPISVTAKTRYRAKEASANAFVLGNGMVKVIFDEPQRAITPGQSLVLYDGDILLGGGIIV